MIAALGAAGFLAVEAEAGTIYARLPVSGAEFHLTAVADEWIACLLRPVRATNPQIAEWRRAHPETGLDIWQGETRLTLRLRHEMPALRQWEALAEELVATSLRWRRAQRSGDEGY